MWRRKPPPETESIEALKESITGLHETEKRRAAVSEISESLRILRERNHFAEQLQGIMGGRK